MNAMSMPGGGGMMTAWLPICGQSWIGTAASFLGLWTGMMAAMMLPSLLPTLWRYRLSRSLGWVTLVACGYLLVWALLGAAVYALGAALATVTMRYPVLARSVPIGLALIVLIAGLLQLTRWKARQLARYREVCRCESPGCGRTLPARAFAALRHGLRIGGNCCRCCAGLTALLLVSGIMDLPAMLGITAAITLERLAPAGERIARAIGIVVIGTGVLLAVRAVGFR